MTVTETDTEGRRHGPLIWATPGDFGATTEDDHILSGPAAILLSSTSTAPSVSRPLCAVS